MRRQTLGLLVAMVVLAGCAGAPSGDQPAVTATEPGSPKGTEATTATPVQADPVTVDFPDGFATGPVVVVTTGSAAVEERAAERLAATIRRGTDQQASVVPRSNLTETQRERALIVVTSDPEADLLRDTSVVNEFRNLAAREGRVIVTDNPWNGSNRLIAVGGPDPVGTWAGTTALARAGGSTDTLTVPYEPPTEDDLDRISAAEEIGGSLVMQLQLKRSYFVQGPGAVNRTYLEDASPAELLFQDVTIYATDRFTESELADLRADGIRISQDSWIPSGDGGSYAASVPIGGIDRLANHSRVTRLETRERRTSPG